MKRDFSVELVSIGDVKLVDPKEQPLTLGSLVLEALLGQFQDENLSGEEKFRRYQLAERISKGGVQEVSAEEVSLIKLVVGKAYVPRFVGPAYLALEQDAVEPTTVGLLADAA